MKSCLKMALATMVVAWSMNSMAAADDQWAFCSDLGQTGSAYLRDPQLGRVPKPSADWICAGSPQYTGQANYHRCVSATFQECELTAWKNNHGQHNVPDGAWFHAVGDEQGHPDLICLCLGYLGY